MSRDIRQVNVFIASPGDASDARDRVRKSIERINRLVAKPSGFLLESIGWEDVPARKAARTQDVINPYVDAADIFIGILNKRFGRPTGVAESGTEEEYNRIEKRWHEEDPKPEIMVYFKTLPSDDLADPGEQLQSVLDFKSRISNTVLYKDFEKEDDLGEKVENALADWIHRKSESSALELRQIDVDVLESTDFEILACLVQRVDENTAGLSSHTNYSKEIIESSIARLDRHGLLVKHHEKIKPSNSTKSFLITVKHLISGDKWRQLLQSDYYSSMLKRTIKDLIAARFHCEIEPETADLLRKLALLSPLAASYVLFGDTTLYDNLAEHAQTLGDQQVAMANEMMKHNILHQTLLRYAEDSLNARLLDNLDGRTISGQLITVCIAAAYDDGLAFDALSKMPLMRFRALTDIEKGQMVTGAPSLFVQTGAVFMHMGEFDLADKEFEKVLAPGIPPDVRAAAMNNKGLILLQKDRIPEAIDFFKKSADLSPGLIEPQKNLEVAESMLCDKKHRTNETAE